ncbi:MAG: hypothetical protein OEV92_06000, partial [Nitrospinota bacterium]|nr:hypothetical protein [Nitrospinota bacterium]
MTTPKFVPDMIFALLLVAACPAVALAQQSSDPIEEGKRLYQMGKMEEAFALVNAAKDRLSGDKAKAEAYLLLGMIYDAQDEKAHADENFDMSVVLDPRKKLAVEYYPPNVIMRHEQA